MPPEIVVPLEFDGHRIYLSATAAPKVSPSEETEVAAHRPTLDGILAGGAAFAEKVAASLRKANVDRLTYLLNSFRTVETVFAAYRVTSR